MKNIKVKEFESKVAQILSNQKTSIIDQVTKHIESFNHIELISFNCENPYNGELKNKIFFTYSNHYKHNSGVWMEVGTLSHPHLSYEDRGYIKGVSTDLDGYLKLRSASYLSHDFITVNNVKIPYFRKSKNSDLYSKQCSQFIDLAVKELDLIIIDQLKTMNTILSEKTGCSLLYYVRNI